jgi:hypothetical protein
MDLEMTGEFFIEWNNYTVALREARITLKEDSRTL